MEKSLLLRKAVYFVVVGLILFPLIHLFFYVPLNSAQWDPFVIEVMSGALLQTTISLVLTIFLGIVGSFGLIGLSIRLKPLIFNGVVIAALAPCFIPPLLVVVLISKTIGQFPIGLGAVVFYHAFTNVGLFSVLFFKILQKKAPQWIGPARVMGLSPFRFLCKGLLPELRGDLLILAFFYFVLFFFSFSIPFLVGGSLYGGIEVFIYEKVMFYGEWSQALHYAVILFAVLFALSSFSNSLGRDYSFAVHRGFNTDLQFLSFPSAALLVVIPPLLLMTGFVLSVPHFWNWNLSSFFRPEIRGTMITGICTGLILLLLSLLICFAGLRNSYSRFLLSLTHPGWVIVGFSLMLLPGQGPIVGYLKLALALALIYFPFVYRLILEPAIRDIGPQMEVARLFPVSWNKFYLEIMLPQFAPALAVVSSVGGLWACGDFAMTGLLLEPASSGTLAFEMKNLVMSYRLDQAIVLVGPLVFYSVIVFILFQGFAYVGSKKIPS